MIGFVEFFVSLMKSSLLFTIIEIGRIFMYVRYVFNALKCLNYADYPFEQIKL